MPARTPVRRFLPIVVIFLGLPFSAAFAGSLEIRGTVELPGENGARCALSLVPVQEDSAQPVPEPAASATSGDGGRFRLQAPASGMWKLMAETPGFPPMAYEPLPLVQSVELPPLVLGQPGRRTSVRLENPAGKPLPGARVCAEKAAAGRQTVAGRGWNVASQCGRTDEQGRFVFLGTPEQRFDVRAHAPGMSEKTGTALAGEEATLRLRAAAAGEPALRAGPPPPGARVSGRILDAATGKPLAGALVWSGKDHSLFSLTDTWGRYDLAVRGPGGSWLQAHAAGYFPQAVSITQGRIQAGQAPALALRSAAEVSGRVVDSEGKPLTGVRVAAFCVQTRFLFRTDPADSRSTSDADGRFRLARLDAADGRTYELRAVREGFATASVPLVRLRPGQLRSLPALTLIRSRSAYGKVLDVEGKPIPGAVVSLQPAGRRPAPGHGIPWPPEGGDEDLPSATSDATGRFRFAELPASRLDLTVTREGYVPATVRGVEVPAGTAPADLGTMFLEPGAVLEGVVVDPAGSGIEGAEILLADKITELESLAATDPELVEPDVVSDAGGRFTVPDLLRGRQVHLLVRRPGYSLASKTGIAPPTRKPLTVVLQPASRVAGRALDEEEKPIAGALFELRFRTPSTDTGSLTGAGESSLMASSDEQGMFEFEGVTPGEARLYGFADGFQLSPVREIQVPEGADVEGLTVVFEKGAVVRGRVLTAGEEPVAGARVHTGGPGVTSDAEGVYLLTGVAPGNQTLEAYDRQHGSAVRKIEVEPGENTFDLVFKPAYEVHGRVVDEAGVGLAQALLRLHSTQGGRAGLLYESLTDEHGSFTLTGVLAGAYGVEATKEGFAPAVLDEGLTVAAEPVDDVEIVLPRGATLSGAVLGLGFYEMAEVLVRVDRDDGWTKSVRPSYEGAYEMQHLPPGDYQVTATLREGVREAKSWITVSPGDEEARRDLELGGALQLTGQVVLGTETVGGVHVILTGFDVSANRSVLTDHEGLFRIEDLRRGSYRLQATDPRRGLLNSLDLELASDRDVRVEFALAEISGQAVDPTRSEPVSSALIVLRHLASPDPAREGYMRALGSDAEGFFHMSEVTAGRYRLTARKEGYSSSEQILDLRGGDRLENLRIELMPSQGLDLEVSLASGGRPPYVTLGALEPSGRAVFFASRPVGPDGIASFSSVPAGSWELMVAAPGGAWVTTTADVPGPPKGLVLPAASRLKVRVPQLSTTAETATLTLTSPDGNPFRDLSKSGELRQRWPLEGGRVIVDSLPANLWTVSVTAQDGQSWSGVVLATGPETEVTLE